MDNISWKSWAFQACAHIRFKPDRAAVEEELLAHLEDKAEAILREKELTVYEAERQALASMGDADEVGRQLAAVYRPWLGYLWLWSRRVLIVCVVAAVWLSLGFSQRVGFGESDLRWWLDFPGYDGYREHYTITELSPECRDESDGYTFTVPAAAVWANEAFVAREEYEGEVYEYAVEENTALYLTVRATSLLPSTEGCDAFRDFYAVDDLGTHYWSYWCRDNPDVTYTQSFRRSLTGNDHATGLWTSEYEASINTIDPAASWIELRYDREGRDVRLRIDLRGGES